MPLYRPGNRGSDDQATGPHHTAATTHRVTTRTQVWPSPKAALLPTRLLLLLTRLLYPSEHHTPPPPPFLKPRLDCGGCRRWGHGTKGLTPCSFSCSPLRFLRLGAATSPCQPRCTEGSPGGLGDPATLSADKGSAMTASETSRSRQPRRAPGGPPGPAEGRRGWAQTWVRGLPGYATSHWGSLGSAPPALGPDSQEDGTEGHRKVQLET